MNTGSRRALVTLLVAASLLALLVVGLPILLIRPFSPQTPMTVALSFHLRGVSPWLAPASAALAVLAASLLLQGRPPRRVAVPVALGASLALGAAWLSHQNHFEWMFRPLPGADYARAREVTFVDDADMVVAVEVNGDAVAFPVRQMAYHHLLNDEAGQVPIVSTY